MQISWQWIFLCLHFTIVTSAEKTPNKVPSNKFRVAQGTMSNRHQFPAVALLYSGKTVCTGSFIARDLVLTAAHCMCAVNAMKRAFSGLTTVEEVNSKSYVQKYAVKSHVVLSAYEDACEKMKMNISSGLVHGSDIALLRLIPSNGMTFQEMDQNPEFAEDIKNISMGLYPIQLDRSYTIVGFGKDEINKLGQLKYGYIVPTKCPGRVSGLENAICHDTADPFNLQTTLEGDSGGPMLDKENSLVVGITSGRVKMSSGKIYGVHASVYHNRKEIRDAIDKLYDGETPPL